MSPAAVMENEQALPKIQVLFLLYPGVDALDVLGPMEVLSKALHNISEPDTKAFEITLAGQTSEPIVAAQGCAFKADISFDEAQKHLAKYDVLVVPGSPGTYFTEIIKKKAQPLALIKAYSDLQVKNPQRERTLLSTGTGSILLAHVGTLAGLSATTHPDFYASFENINRETSLRDLSERADVLEERYVVNNLRFDLEDPDQKLYIRRGSRASATGGRRPSAARKGSNAWMESNTRSGRRESLKLGGLRVITAGGSSCGIDASLYLVSAMVDEQAANEICRTMAHIWNKGVVVDGLDV